EPQPRHPHKPRNKTQDASAAGAGVTHYVNELTSTYGGKTVMFASKPVDTQDADPNKPTKYDPNTDDSPSATGPGKYVKLTQSDLDALADFKGVREVEYFSQVTTKYVQAGNHQYEASVGRIPGQELQIAEGKKPDDKNMEFQVLLPADYVDALGFDDAKDAIDETVTIGLEDATETMHTVEAKVVGVARESLNQGTERTLTSNDALEDRLLELQRTGLPDGEPSGWNDAVLWLDDDFSDQDIATLKERLDKDGYKGSTTSDIIGQSMAVINAITFGLNMFAAVALLAAALGIANTLLMSVQERTQEIGLMKAVGMRGGKIFALFSWEAILLGFSGSLIGIVLAAVVGSGTNSSLSAGLLAQLPGLNLFTFEPGQMLGITALIVAIAFVAGTLPAFRAARKEPIEALRYE
ncbi:MAG: FtsX-like permease family protein, partial [Propionibacteriaceae bacterium]|nr:FtsX-like permease family protein [Propionibacteriaceae bacterium]